MALSVAATFRRILLAAGLSTPDPPSTTRGYDGTVPLLEEEEFGETLWVSPSRGYPHHRPTTAAAQYFFSY